MSTFRCAALSLCALACNDNPDPATRPPIVHTPVGAVEGFVDEQVAHFLGIPFAEAPTADLRFRPPEPVAAWLDTRQATASGPICPQWVDGEIDGSEDCLTLDVRLPADALSTDTPLPVMVWVHGGALTAGGVGIPQNDTTALARDGNVVVVSLSYRLGALGFLATPELQDDSDDGSVGNYGLRDLVLGLQWVQDAIEGFGGDPTQVTLFGESAGGANVASLAALPAADGLFDAVIVQSSPSTSTLPDVRLGASAFAPSEALVEAMECDTSDPVACLRTLPVEDLVGALDPFALESALTSGLGVNHIVDGVFLPAQPMVEVASGRRPERRWIVGSTRDEAGWLRLEDLSDDINAFTYPLLIADSFGDLAPTVLELYPADFAGTPVDSLVAVLSELLVTCPTLELATALAASDQQTFHYRTSHALSGDLARLGAFHALDVFLLFDTVDRFGLPYEPVPDDTVAGDVMRTGWSSFAAGQVPAGWAPFTATEVVDLGTEAQVVDFPTEARCTALREAAKEELTRESVP